MQAYAHSNCKYLHIIEMHDYQESKTFNENHEFKERVVCSDAPMEGQSLFSAAPKDHHDATEYFTRTTP